jgi:putative pre-16S rRNA nuclease
LHEFNYYVIILARILALDYGTKRTGIAVTDELQIIASGLTTVETKKIFSFLTEYLKNEKVELFIIGEPKQLNYTESESEQFIKIFIKKLSTTFPKIPIKRVDERFTSKMAFQSMIDSGLKKKQRQNKALLDEISATIILQTYLQQHEK